MENEPNEKLATVESKSPNHSIASAIIVAALIIGGAIFVNKGRANSPMPGANGKLDLVAQVSDQDFIRGDKNAPITLIEYADFSCHFCAKFQPELSDLIKEYDGKVKWVYRHLPIFNMDAAVASTCVGRLGGEEAFWTYADALFANQDKFNAEYYADLAGEAGVSAEKFKACIADPLVRSSIQTDFTKSKILLGFNATPYTVLVDKMGRKFSFAGALPYNEVKGAIDALDQ